MNEQNQTAGHTASWGKVIFKGFIQLLSIPVVLAALVVIYEISVSDERSLWVKINERLGEGQKAVIEAAAPTEAWKEQMFQQAVAEIERVNIAYQNLWQANSQIMVIAYQMEDKVLQSQMDVIKDTYGAAKFNTNIADLGCAVNAFIPDPTLKQACRYAQEQRTKMARDLKNLAEQHRSLIPKDILQGLPKPEDLELSEQRLRDLLGGIDNG